MGTSATLGSEEEKEELTEYASAVFGEQFAEDSIITESRLSAGEFLENSLVSRVDIVAEETADELNPSAYNNYEEYIKAQYRLWFGENFSGGFDDPEWRIDLGEKIKEHLFFQNLLKT